MLIKSLNTIWKQFCWDNNLNKNEIHLFLCALESIKSKYDIFYFIISNEEKNNAEKFYFEKDRIRYVLSHGILRSIISKFSEINTNEIYYKKNEFGKPFLTQETKMQIFFNLSHSENLCLIGINPFNEIGVDIEYIKTDFDFENIVEKYFVKNEIDKIFIHPEKELQRQAFFDCWTRKESFIKAVGKGLSIPLDSFEVDLNNSFPKIKIYNDELNNKNWKLLPIEINFEYKSTVCLKQNNSKINYWLII